MKFSYKWLKDIVGFNESPEHLAELLTLRSFEIESIEKVGSDWALDIKIPANRISDAAHHIGLAQEIAAAKGIALKPKKDSSASFKKGNVPLVKLTLEKADLASRYSALLIRITGIGGSPLWIQERLITSGFRPLNAVVDVTNYVMLEMGEPMHAFDLAKVKGRAMHVRESRAGETLTTLDGTHHELPEATIIIEDRERIIDLAGIMGGENSAVSQTTKEIFLQAAVFDPVRIYRTTRALRFSTAASKVYAAGIDASRTVRALVRSVELLKECGVLESAGDIIDVYPKKEKPIKIRFRPEYANRLIGEKIESAFYKKAFSLLGFRVSGMGSAWIIEVPPGRRDILIEEDLIEEAVRLFGYERIKPKMPEGARAVAREFDEMALEFRVRDYLKAKGFFEVFVHQFMGARELELFSLPPESALMLENPLNPETAYLAPRILGKYISSAAGSMRSFNSVRIFGMEKSFLKRSGRGSESLHERKDLIIVSSEKGVSGEAQFYQLKGIADGLFESLGIREHWYEDRSLATQAGERLFHPYRAGRIRVDGDQIGTLGEVHPVLAEELKARFPLVALEIDFSLLLKHVRDDIEFREISRFPSIMRDISLIVPSDVRTDDVLEEIESAAEKHLIDVDLFDYFEDDEMRKEEKKSMAFHLIFQGDDRTLTDAEVEKAVFNIIKVLEAKQWEVRK